MNAGLFPVPWVREKHDGCRECAKAEPPTGHEHKWWAATCSLCGWVFWGYEHAGVLRSIIDVAVESHFGWECEAMPRPPYPPLRRETRP